MRVALPPPDELARRWNEIEPLLARAMARGLGTHEPVDFLALTFAGNAAIWLVEDESGRIAAAAACQVRQFPRKRGYEVLAVAGDGLPHWGGKLHERMEAQARALHCDFIFGAGRNGWHRVARSQAGGLIMWRML